MNDHRTSGTKVTRRALLQTAVTAAQVQQFAARKGGHETELEWLDAAQRWQHKTTWRIDSTLSLWHIEDNVAGCSYIQAASADIESADQLLGEVETEHSPVCIRTDLLNDVEEARDSIALGLALIRLGITGSVSFDEEVYEALSTELYSEHDEVRDMAVSATSYAPYLEYRPDLERNRRE